MYADFEKFDLNPASYVNEIPMQPMNDENGVITYNQEIYNYKDLKYEHEIY